MNFHLSVVFLIQLVHYCHGAMENHRSTVICDYIVTHPIAYLN